MNKSILIQSKKAIAFIFVVYLCSNFALAQNQSIAKMWNKELIKAIRKDFARPPVHARNLYHTSVAMHEAWAAYENNEEMFLLGKTIGNFTAAFAGVATPSNILEAQKEALSFAFFRLIKHRFQNSPGVSITTNSINAKMDSLGYNRNNVSIDYINGGPAELGNYIANRIIAWGYQDGSNEINNYANQYYQPVNNVIEVEQPGNPNMLDPNRWQAISLSVAIDQSGNILTSTPPHLAPEWGNVRSFALTDSLRTLHTRNGNTFKVYRDAGAPPQLDTINAGDLDDFYKWNYAMVSVWQSHLDTTDNVMWDISPASIGNINSYPTNWSEYQNFYDFFNGGDNGQGRTINPITNQPYAPQIVKRGDYARVLAEFWADGLDSETPAGHWFAIYNKVIEHPLFVKQWAGQGPILSDLEYDIKAYLTLSGAMHDAAICAWSHKGWYDSPRPVSSIRYMAGKGQSTDQNLPNYHPAGIPLIPGFIEVVDEMDALAGLNNENIGKIKLYTWKGPTYISNPQTDMSGVGWILAENFWPYQRPTFVSPPFAGYISGHSTFSAAAAKIMTEITGSEYFPGGMSDFVAGQNDFLHFEEGPSQTISLQWATYKDASDQCSLSRIWGGIHPPVDDIPGRFIGQETGSEAFIKANNLFEIQKPFVSNLGSNISVVNLQSIDDTLSLNINFSEPMDTLVNPVITFLNTNHPLLHTLQLINSSWINNQEFILNYKILEYNETLDSVFVQVKNAKNSNGATQKIFVSERPFRVDKKRPLISSIEISNPIIADLEANSPLTITINYNEKCDTTVAPMIDIVSPSNLQSSIIQNLTNSVWINENSFVAFFDVVDNNVTIDSIDLHVSNARDIAGNIQDLWIDSNAVYIDTRNPILTSFNVNDSTLNIADIGAQSLIIELNFDKEMNQNLNPEIIFSGPNNLNSILTLSIANTTWLSPNACKLTYNLQNLPFELSNIDASIINIKDVFGNSPSTDSIFNFLNIDTKRPEVIGTVKSSSVIADNQTGSGNFNVIVEFSETMNTQQKPILQLLNNQNVLSDVAYHVFSSSWLDQNHFKANFNVSDNNIEIDSLEITINFAKDISGNPQSIVSYNNYVRIDTKNPELISLYANTYNLINTSNQLVLLSVFNEDMQQNSISEFQFLAETNINNLFVSNSTESSWLNSLTYESVYDIIHDTLFTAEVDVVPTNLFDLAGNEIQSSTIQSFININFENVGIIENKDEIYAYIFPNPIQNSSVLNLIVKERFIVQTLSINSIDGKQVFFENVENKNLSNHTINISNLISGMYFLELKSKSTSKTIKFIINM
jgi:uncharacterized surface protein with fasciclin (FAS1) repeats